MRYPALFALALLGSLPSAAQVSGLSFRPVDASYSLAIDRIILISANPNQLHIYDPVGQSDQVVALSEPPLNLSLSTDGAHAAVAYVDAIAYVDLQAQTIIQTFSNIAVGTGKVILGQSYVYVFPSYEGSIISVNLSSSQATISGGSYESGGVFDPAVNAIYSTEDGITPNNIYRYDTSAGVIGNGSPKSGPYFGVFSICGPLYLSHNGATIYSSCGTVFHASADPTMDMRYLGVLPGLGAIQGLATSDSLSQIAAIPRVSTYSQPPTTLADTVVDLFDSSTFNPVGQFATTPFLVESISYPAHGRWVFYNASSSAMFIVTQADSSAALEADFAVETVNLSNPNSCNAMFGATSASAPAPGRTRLPRSYPANIVYLLPLAMLPGLP